MLFLVSLDCFKWCSLSTVSTVILVLILGKLWNQTHLNDKKENKIFGRVGKTIVNMQINDQVTLRLAPNRIPIRNK
jgi:hypothetical protein